MLISFNGGSNFVQRFACTLRFIVDSHKNILGLPHLYLKHICLIIRIELEDSPDSCNKIPQQES